MSDSCTRLALAMKIISLQLGLTASCLPKYTGTKSSKLKDCTTTFLNDKRPRLNLASFIPSLSLE